MLKFITLILSVFLFQHSLSQTILDQTYLKQTAYDEFSGMKYMNYSIVAYCNDKYLTNWNCGFICTQNPLYDVSVFHDLRYNAQAYVGIDSESNLIVSFRGTQFDSIINWFNDIRFFTTPYIYCDQCKVEKGFYETYQSIQDMLNLVQKFHQNMSINKIIVMGHSLGGAMATIATMDLYYKYNIIINELWTYGSPRAGNDYFHSAFVEIMNKYNISSFRVVNKADPVPHLPPLFFTPTPANLTSNLRSNLRSIFKSPVRFNRHLGLIFNYYHIPQEIWYKTFTDYVVCDTDGEDKSCSDSLLIPLNVANHLDYYGFDRALDLAYCSLQFEK